jgi:hypothetical protein
MLFLKHIMFKIAFIKTAISNMTLKLLRMLSVTYHLLQTNVISVVNMASKKKKKKRNLGLAFL